tara:strand:+ start:186 stop:434 length:249 start_codon:yes stop_codon:yes gene_type:complete
MSDKYVYWRELGDMFKAYTAPKLMRVLDANGIPYRKDAKGKPMVERVHVDSTATDTTSAAEAMDNMDAAISEFPTSVTVTPD